MSLTFPPAKIRHEDLPKGYVCFCGRENRLPIYVFKHWQEYVATSCAGCSRAVITRRGIAWPKLRRSKDPENKSFFKQTFK